MIGTQAAHHRTTEKLGEGGMGRVCRTTDSKLNRDVSSPAKRRIPIAIVLLIFVLSGPAAAHQRDYEFSHDWFSSNIVVWRQVLAPFVGRPDVHYLEVGVLEGRSAVWMLDNVLTDPSATLTAVDLFPGDLKERFLANIRRSGRASQTTTIQGVSQEALHHLNPDSYDIVYVDGGHTAEMVLVDLVLAWRLLKEGGLLILDDYAWRRDEYPDEARPQVAIDGFVTAFRNSMVVVHRQYQMIVRKRPGARLDHPYRSLVGDFGYDWEARLLFDQSADTEVSLSDNQRQLLERILLARRFGEVALEADLQVESESEVAALERLLGVEIRHRSRSGSPAGGTLGGIVAALAVGLVAGWLLKRRS